MTVDNETPKPQPIPMNSTPHVGEIRFEKLPDHDPEAPEVQAVHPHPHPHGQFHGPPPHVRKFMKKKMKRTCCCLVFLMMLNLMVACYIAKKVNYLSFILMPDSPIKYMPGGSHPFCSDLCVDLCTSDEEYSMDCDVADCVESCGIHFEDQIFNDDSSESSDSIEESSEEEAGYADLVVEDVPQSEASEASEASSVSSVSQVEEEAEVEDEVEEVPVANSHVSHGSHHSHGSHGSRGGRGGRGHGGRRSSSSSDDHHDDHHGKKHGRGGKRPRSRPVAEDLDRHARMPRMFMRK